MFYELQWFDPTFGPKGQWFPDYGYKFKTKEEAEQHALDELEWIRDNTQKEKFRIVLKHKDYIF